MYMIDDCIRRTVSDSILTVCFNREMFHARRWHEDSRFFTPMTDLVDGTHVFIRDCVNIVHTVLGRVTGVILKYFVKVKLCVTLTLLSLLFL